MGRFICFNAQSPASIFGYRGKLSLTKIYVFSFHHKQSLHSSSRLFGNLTYWSNRTSIALIKISNIDPQVHCDIFVEKINIPLESLGDSITTAVLLSWSKKVGDPVKEDDVIGIVETDKVTLSSVFKIIKEKKSYSFYFKRILKVDLHSRLHSPFTVY